MIILDQLLPIHLSRNPILLNLTAMDISGYAYRPTGAGAALITDAPTFNENDTLTIAWTAPDLTTNTITFTIKNTPTASNEVPNTLRSIAATLARHPQLGPHFLIDSYVSAGEPRLVIEARDAAANFIVTISHTITVAANYAIRVESWLKTATTKPDDYKIQVIIYFEDSFFQGNWLVAKTFDVELEDDGSIMPIDISSILNNECERTITENPFLKYTDSAPQLTDNTRRFYVQYREVMPNTTTQWATTDAYFVMNAGLSNRVFLQEFYNFFTTRNTSNSLLTYKNNVRRVIRGQKHFLSWYNFTNETQTPALKITYTDFTGNHTIYKFDTPVQAHFTLTFPISPQALGVPEDAIHYNITIESQTGVPLSTNRVFCVIETRFFNNTRNIAYLNAFGCPETQLATGDFTKSVSIDRTLSTGVRFDSIGRTALVSKAKRSKYNIFFTYRIAPTTAIENEQLTEIDLSPVLFDLTDSLQLALVFKDSRQTLKSVTDTGETLYERTIDAEPRISMVNFATDAQLFSTIQVENVVQLAGNGTGTYTPTNPNNPIGNAGLTLVEIGAVKDTDMVLLAKLNENGTLGGYLMYPAGKLMRDIRGIDHAETSHLNGLGIKDEAGNFQTIAFDKYGSEIIK